MAPIPCFLISSGSKKKEPRYMYPSEAKVSHSHKMWAEISSSVPHFLKSLCPLGPKKEHSYATLYPQRVPASESPPGSPTGPLWRKISAYRAFLTLTLSGTVCLTTSTNQMSTNHMSTNHVSTNHVSTNHVFTNHVSTNHMSTNHMSNNLPRMKTRGCPEGLEPNDIPFYTKYM